MPSRTVRITVPTGKIEDYRKLLNAIVKRHTDLGGDSPLTNDPDIDMTLFASQLAQADNLRQQAEELRRQSENTMQQARKLYGVEKGQTIDTPGTLLFTTDLIRSLLLKKYKGNEEALSEFGFNVVVGQAKSPQPKNKAA